jgi:hypothetical protein
MEERRRAALRDQDAKAYSFWCDELYLTTSDSQEDPPLYEMGKYIRAQEEGEQRNLERIVNTNIKKQHKEFKMRRLKVYASLYLESQEKGCKKHPDELDVSVESQLMTKYFSESFAPGKSRDLAAVYGNDEEKIRKVFYKLWDQGRYFAFYKDAVEKGINMSIYKQIEAKKKLLQKYYPKFREKGGEDLNSEDWNGNPIKIGALFADVFNGVKKRLRLDS